MQFGLSHPPLLVSVTHDQTSLIINGVQITLGFDVHGSRASTKQTEQRIRAERCTWSDNAVCSPLHPKLHFMQIQQEKDWSVRGCIMAGIYVVKAAPSRCQYIGSQPTLHYITVKEADELPVVVMGTENDLLVMLTSLRLSSATKTYIIMKCCRNLEIV